MNEERDSVCSDLGTGIDDDADDRKKDWKTPVLSIWDIGEETLNGSGP